MLCLSRKVNEAIKIVTQDGTISVKVSRLGSGRVRLALDAPPSVVILRSEIQGKESSGGQSDLQTTKKPERQCENCACDTGEGSTVCNARKKIHARTRGDDARDGIDAA